MRRVVPILLLCLCAAPASAQRASGPGGSETRDSVLVDGPIIYGTGMNDADRRKAWGHFFDTVTRAVVEQGGQAALDASLSPRCMPGQEFCTIMLGANLVGVGNVQEARKVTLMIVVDAKDTKRQLMRVVCTRPAPDVHVCLDWTTGKLLQGGAP